MRHRVEATVFELMHQLPCRSAMGKRGAGDSSGYNPSWARPHPTKTLFTQPAAEPSAAEAHHQPNVGAQCD